MAQTLDILDKLVAFDTVSANSNLGIIAYIEEFLRARGFAVHRVPDDSGEKAGLFASIGPEGAGLMLSAHTDVVPVAGQDWSRDPFCLTAEGDKLFGRGTTDMKGCLAAMLRAADRASVAELREPLKLAISYDEEVGCLGIRDMIDQLAPSIGLPRAALVGEPTEMQVAIGHKGKAGLRAICTGQNGHSALAPNFVNALHLAADFVSEMRVLQDELAAHGARDEAYTVPYSTVHVGKLAGGEALNIVPDRAEITFEYRHLAEDDPGDLRARMEAAANRVAARYTPRFDGARIEISEYMSYPGLSLPGGAPVIGLAQRLAQTNGTTKVAFGTEAGYFDALGVPTVVCGPGSMEGQGHKPDEYITRSQLAACDAMMDRVIKEISA
ncbi:acetylornithine deacetylase [Roseovarius faecimaris]|uniref:Acetylornithine deacetylase n=1 Tax=Roseovarius faecimaris TaxID=2494550 RepID=A0A6I6IND9_9RHOB|nr:acetylornithine deacetylase [Roseovarius faecimaris]QGX98559.1 acetylornithine deacetylase [Roseovarius faecimaris]